MNKVLKRCAIIITTGLLTIGLTACDGIFGSIGSDIKGQLVGQAFTMTAYDNSGNETLSAHGTKVGMEGNEVTSSKSTNSDGKTTTSTSLSAVVTVTIDGKEIESAGDTLVFNEDGLTPVKNYAKDKIAISSDASDWLDNTLIAKPLNRFKNLFGKKCNVIIIPFM